MVEKVYRREEIYSGENLDKAPDLLIEWCYDGVISGITYPDEDGNKIEVSSPQEVFERRNISGDHRPEGIFIARGNNIRKPGVIEDANLMDIAPTVLYMMNQAVPDDMDGKVLEQIFEDGFLADNPVRKAAYGDDKDKHIHDFTDEESKKIEERLKGLGYME